MRQLDRLESRERIVLAPRTSSSTSERLAYCLDFNVPAMTDNELHVKSQKYRSVQMCLPLVYDLEIRISLG